MAELHDLSAAELSDAYRTRRLGPVEVLRAVLAHIERWEPHLHATYALEAAAALAQAEASQARWLKGETVPPYAKVVALAKWLKVPVENLYGAGGRHAAEEARPKFGPEIGYQERELFEAFLKLPAPQRRIVREIIVAFSKSVGQ
jgi:Asp-tRNA(Asn)/Glu-tRNA(Gln) amidotransferase A subunit family amidase